MPCRMSLAYRTPSAASGRLGCCWETKVRVELSLSAKRKPFCESPIFLDHVSPECQTCRAALPSRTSLGGCGHVGNPSIRMAASSSRPVRRGTTMGMAWDGGTGVPSVGNVKNTAIEFDIDHNHSEGGPIKKIPHVPCRACLCVSKPDQTRTRFFSVVARIRGFSLPPSPRRRPRTVGFFSFFFFPPPWVCVVPLRRLVVNNPPLAVHRRCRRR